MMIVYFFHAAGAFFYQKGRAREELAMSGDVLGPLSLRFGIVINVSNIVIVI